MTIAESRRQLAGTLRCSQEALRRLEYLCIVCRAWGGAETTDLRVKSSGSRRTVRICALCRDGLVDALAEDLEIWLTEDNEAEIEHRVRRELIEAPGGTPEAWTMEQLEAELDRRKIVYFIEHPPNGYIKIGYTRDERGLRSRLKSGRRLLATERGGYRREQELHRDFHADRLILRNGRSMPELFRPSDRLLAYIASLQP